LAHILIGEPVPTSPEYALASWISSGRCGRHRHRGPHGHPPPQL